MKVITKNNPGCSWEIFLFFIAEYKNWSKMSKLLLKNMFIFIANKIF